MERTLSFFALIILMSCVHIQAPNKPSKSVLFNWIRTLETKYVVGNFPINNNGVAISSEGIAVPLNNKIELLGLSSIKKWERVEKSRISSAPIISDEKVIYSLMNGELVQRNIISGKNINRTELGSGAKAPPYIRGQYAAIALLNNSVSLVDLESGNVLWNYQRTNSSKSSLSQIAQPLIYDGKVIAGFSDGHIVSLNASNGEVIWSTTLSIGERFIGIYPYINKVGDKIIAGTQEAPMAILDINSGKIIKRLPYILSTEFLEFDNAYFFGNDKGHIIKLSKDFETVKEERVFKKGLAQLKVFKNNIYGIDFSGKLIAFDKDLKVESKFELGSSVSTAYGALEASEDQLLLYSSRYRLYSIK